MEFQNFIEVYRAKNNVQAVLFQQALQEAGIRATVENGLLTGGAIDLIGWSTNPRILVESKDELAALKVIEQTESLEKAGAEAREAEEHEIAQCLACGTAMPDDVSECPACGWS